MAHDEIKKGKIPKKMKPDGKEFYLSDEEFHQVLGMSKDAWSKLNTFKRNDMKNKQKLN